jgi:glyoxylase-like metal-dependent hydrolase (beta-lactamase superfamily II)/ferredoxin
MWSMVIILIQFLLFADEWYYDRVDAFVGGVRLTTPPLSSSSSSLSPSSSSCLSATAARGRLLDNVDGPLYVNDKCINCAACSLFSPSVFARNGYYHVVCKQPSSEKEIEESRAALAACPVAAIRVEHNEHDKDNDSDAYAYAYDHRDEFAINPKSHPFPRLVSSRNFSNNVYYIGHHNSKSFGAIPYLLSSSTTASSSKSASPAESAESKFWIMVDTPKYSQSSIDAIESITGSNGPSYLVLTHVDDTADHNKWKNKYPNLKRIFHSGDLGPIYNWIGDDSLKDVEILLKMKSSVSVSDNGNTDDDDDNQLPQQLQIFDINGNPINNNDNNYDDNDVVLVHTPGHSPGSISLLKRPKRSINGVSSIISSSSSSSSNSSGYEYPGVIFTGDTYSYTTRDDGHMTGFPLYGNDLRLQSKIIPLLLDLDWLIIAPGHGHVRDYTPSTATPTPTTTTTAAAAAAAATTTTMTSTTTSATTTATKNSNDIREKEMVDAIDELLRYS